YSAPPFRARGARSRAGPPWPSARASRISRAVLEIDGRGFAELGGHRASELSVLDAEPCDEIGQANAASRAPGQQMAAEHCVLHVAAGEVANGGEAIERDRIEVVMVAEVGLPQRTA